MGFVSDFKTFLMKGEIVMLATAVIIGGAFGKVVTSNTYKKYKIRNSIDK